MMPEGWTVNGEGMAAVATELPAILRRMLGPNALLPRVLFTDRGTGMYAPSGHIVADVANAADAAGFRPYWGAVAKQQSPDMGDMLLRETAVAWFRSKMKREKPSTQPWEESRAQWSTRAARCVREINKDNDVAGLRREFPSRLQQCLDSEGERLRK